MSINIKIRSLLSFVVLSLCLIVGSNNAFAAEFNQIDGKMFDQKLEAAKGKVVVVNFFATWCPPCQEEVPLLERMYKKYPAEQLEFIAISLDEDVEEIAPFLKKMGSTYPVLLGAQDLIAKFKLSAIPRNLIFDKEGKKIVDEEGLIEEADLNKTIGALIGK